MRYGSVCSGIEAATMAWHPLGWTPAFFSEIEKFPSAVLAHHYGSNMPGEPASNNGVPNYGDMTNFEEWPDHAIDLLVGGTPCQSYSIAGLREGLDDPRGNLMLTYGAIARRYRPKWLAWENVPGVLSSEGGRDFASLLGLLSGCRVEVPASGWGTAGVVQGYKSAYGLAWRVLDAQFVRVDGFGRAVPQRRRRVFVVGYLGDWRRAAAVFLERASLSGDSAPSREKGQGTPVSVAPCLRAGGNQTGGDRPYGTDVDTCDSLLPIAIQERAISENADAGPDGVGVRQDGAAYTLEARQVPQAVAFDTTQITSKSNYSNPQPGDPCHPLAAGAHAPAIAFGWQNSASQGDSVSRETSPSLDKSKTPAVAFDMRGRECGAQFEGPHDTANIRAASGGSSRSYVAEAWAVRRLMPIECERLQGFPDGFTNIPWRGKSEASDGPRYKALGNSMAVNAMRWIGRRIAMVDALSVDETQTVESA
ncbi:MAG: DNA cytosine methyltransferase [Mesorhizobium sp.]|uniref:DNA cytosine methyltransferase n=1 Tax=Mesorhizobium sp. TaxID=1871066 RepID=UPI00121248F0|nr:DNA cytosine methyltransferase [Mesorhizobium sp.]TIM41784.1 MAG: DNA cytosine methyltransferase [Mesorhizobium sp.]